MSSARPSGAPSPTPDRDPGAATATAIADAGAALVDALERHLPGARRHAEATGERAQAIAARLGRGEASAAAIREAAKLHDVGMVYLPRATLRRAADEVGDADRALLASQIEAGATLARGAGVPPAACEWILHTRERFDGAGPAHLRGDAIPLEARAIRLACAYDLMLASTDRATAIAALRAAAGAELDPAAVEALAQSVGEDN